MMKLRAILFLMAIIAPLCVRADLIYGDRITVDNVTYKVTNTNPKEVQVGCGFDDQAIDQYITVALNIPSSVIGRDGKEYSVTSIGEYAFQDCYGLTSVVIPNSVTTIRNLAFYGCTSLTSVTIPNSVTSIEYNVFNGCSSLRSITIPNSMTSIGDYTFNNWNGLTSITIPNSVTSIGDHAFQDCTNLTSVAVEKTTPISISSTTFTNRANATLYVPYGSKSAYEAANYWKDFKNIIESAVPSEAGEVEIGGIYYCLNYNDMTAEVIKNPNNYKGEISIPGSVKLTYRTYKVTNIGSQAFKDCSKLTSVTIPRTVTSIGGDAFAYCSKLERVNISDLAAWCNISFASAYSNPITSSHCLYLNGEKINDLVIPSSVTSIGYAAFYSCTSLTSVTIPNSVTIIGSSAFHGCSSITAASLGNGLTSIEDWTFAGCRNMTSINIPDNVTSIGKSAFQDCRSLTSIIIPNGVTTIGQYAFNSCSALTSLIIPESVTSIVNNAFNGCTSLTSAKVLVTDHSAFCTNKVVGLIINFVSSIRLIDGNGDEIEEYVIPNDVTSIGRYAFTECTGLTSITIPSSVTSIGSYAFQCCSSLTSAIIRCEPITIGSYVFEFSPVEEVTFDCGTVTNLFRNSSTLQRLTLTENVTYIYNEAFSSCSNLTSVVVRCIPSQIESSTFYNSPVTQITFDCEKVTHLFCGLSTLESVTLTENVTDIGFYAFASCFKLSSVNIPNSVTNIGSSAFQACHDLSSISIPESVTSIGSCAFDGCSNLTKVKVENATPLTIRSDVFSNSTNAILYVPRGSKSSYSSATNWSSFNAIKEYPDGDVNQDSETDVVDVVDIARFVVGTPSTLFDEFLADMNGNGSVTVADAIVLVNDIAGDTDFARGRAAASQNQSDNVLSLNGDGSNLSLQMEGNDRFAAFQFDLWLPSDMDVMQLSLNDVRRQGHQLLYHKVSDGHYRVVALSTSANAFNGISGELLGITLDNYANDGVYIDNIHFVTTSGIDVPFEPVRVGYTTGIYLQKAINNDNQPIYNLNGQRLNSPRKGLNIMGGKKIIVK